MKSDLPILPFHPAPGESPAEFFDVRSSARASDLDHRRVLRKATATYYAAVATAKARFLDHEAARTQAAAVKREAIENLDKYLEVFESNVVANGGRVHWAQSADDAVRIIVEIAKAAGVTHAVKGKSMATEEIHLNDHLRAAGVEPVETDLGEFICQLRGEPPYHIVTPVMHLTKADIADTFQDRLGVARTEVAEELTMIARAHLRRQFVTAVMGVTGANFLVADVGMVAITENEGNARLSFSLPQVHVAVAGIEKVIPRLEDLALFWPLLAASGTGQHLTCYNSIVGGPRRAGEPDGPREFHVVLLDNGRTRLLADPEQRDAAHCIRCGACLNVCPVFKSAGGHAYGTTYQGPIGSVITPHLRGLGEWKHLSYASSLCGNCTEVCPVRIDIAHHLLHNRRNAVAAKFASPIERAAFRVWLWGMTSPRRYRWMARLARVGQSLFRAIRLDRGWVRTPLDAWTRSRTLPRFAQRSFRQMWQSGLDQEGT